MASLDQLLLELEKTPRDWDLRLRIIERYVNEDDLESAKKLVRESPDGPVPYPVQRRLWGALSGQSEVRIVPSDGNDSAKPQLVAKANVLAPGEEWVLPKPVPYQSRRAAAASAAEKSKDSKKPDPGEIRSIPKPHSDKTPEPPKLRKQKAAAQEAEVAGIKLEAFDARVIPSRDQPRTAGKKMSALSMALMLHFGLIVLFTFVAIHVPIVRAPQITVLPAPPGEEESVMRKSVVQKVEVSKPAAPSMSATMVITANAASEVKMPEIEKNTRQLDVNLLDTAVGMSRGLSFEGEGMESAVSFFGIEGGGRRIAFIVDANPEMLLDEKGGMFAYDKVKAEIGAMLGALNRGTAFNIFVYQGKRISMFRSEPVRALPSNVSRAIKWLDPLNRNYEALGLREDYTEEGIRHGATPIDHRDIAYYSKAIQAALEQDVNAVFCISNGWGAMNRSLSPEDQAILDEARAKHQEEVQKMEIETTYDPKEVAAWQKAQEKAREWLKAENEARRSKGLAPKVVLNFGQLVQEISPGARPPQGVRSAEPPPGPSMADLGIERMPPYTPEDVETHIDNVVTANYGKNKPDRPKIHLVLFLGEREDIGTYEEHFVRFTRSNQGELKILRGLAALSNVTDFSR